jgi:hypothetical protein
MKNYRVTSRVNLLNGEKNQRFKDYLCPRLEGTDQFFIVQSRRENYTSYKLRFIAWSGFSLSNDITQNDR